MAIQSGTQLRSPASASALVVVRGTSDEGELIVAGAPATADAPAGDATGDGADVLALGKRYVDDASGLEVLIVTRGAGPIVFDGRELTIKSAKALPASD
jgi:hypothetical protein